MFDSFHLTRGHRGSLTGAPFLFCGFLLFSAPMAGRDPVKQQEAKRRYYERNKEVVKTKARNHTRETRAKIKQWLHNYLLGHPCVDCGETDPIILEFDHVDRANKEFTIGEANTNGISLKRVIAEVAKCEVRCANCHRKKTYRESGRTHRS